MIPLPIYYSGQIVAQAKVDNELEPLTSLQLSCAMPRRIYRLAPGRPDVIAAMLKEDKSLQRVLKPFYSMYDTQIRLVHIALKPEMLEYIFPEEPEYIQGIELLSIDLLRSSIGRVAFANLDSCDCRSENLREVSQVV